MKRLSVIFLSVFFAGISLFGQKNFIVVADSVSKTPLSSASIFDNRGKFIGISGLNGRLPKIASENYPITVRYIGFYEKTVHDNSIDTVFMQENIMELPEVTVEARGRNVLHILAYLREYSTLSTYTDTIFMFREKMVDYMLPTEPSKRFKGWDTPRVLASKSYYHFTDRNGLDSVSGNCSQHFSWSDWIGIPPEFNFPASIREGAETCDTLKGKYSPIEIWSKNKERIGIDVDILADSAGWKWVPYHSLFFRDNIDFDRFSLKYKYNNVGETKLSPTDLYEYSFNIESNGRGGGVFLFNRKDEPFFVTTYAEGYVIDKEFISAKEAKKWEKLKRNHKDVSILEPDNAPDLHPTVRHLIDRVNTLDNDEIRLSMTPDQRLVGRKVDRVNIGKRIAKRVLGMFGLDQVIGNHKREKNWKEFRNDQKTKRRKEG